MPHPAIPPRIAVYGAAGHTGRFVVRALLDRGFAVLALGRDAGRLDQAGLPAGVQTGVADLADRAALDHHLAATFAVVNCAGPFLDTAGPLADAALRAGVHYLDVTAEQDSARRLHDRAAEARSAGIVMIPAMSFWGGLADLLVTATLADWTHADAIRIGAALDSWEPTPGTRLTGQRNTVPRLTVSDGRLSPLTGPAGPETWAFGGGFGTQDMVELPFSEMILIASHLTVPTVRHFLNAAPLADLRNPDTPPPTPRDSSGRSAQRFRVEVEVRQGEVVRRAAVEGRDIYGVTGPIVAEAVTQMVLNPPPPGVHAPGAVFDAPAFLKALEPHLL
ncbi:saccharopine dehydrogenase NADP-binding domain-containing protein [Brevundimonas sp. R86498]|uniref:saccharopine dehydrogenase NADP-binding domain-containing protein n=1 Tax=Brevundimonas sp. R86498 TaxID=3093845 RepID=UPI0037C765B5